MAFVAPGVAVVVAAAFMAGARAIRMPDCWFLLGGERPASGSGLGNVLCIIIIVGHKGSCFKPQGNRLFNDTIGVIDEPSMNPLSIDCGCSN